MPLAQVETSVKSHSIMAGFNIKMQIGKVGDIQLGYHLTLGNIKITVNIKISALLIYIDSSLAVYHRLESFNRISQRIEQTEIKIIKSDH